MDLFPRRSYFLLAISMGPTSLYPDKPSSKNDLFFWYIEKAPQRPYDQNGGSIALRSLIFDPIAKENVYQKTRILGMATTTAAATTAAEEFPVPARPHPITQGYHIPFGSSPSLRQVFKMFGKHGVIILAVRYGSWGFLGLCAIQIMSEDVRPFSLYREHVRTMRFSMLDLKPLIF